MAATARQARATQQATNRRSPAHANSNCHRASSASDVHCTHQIYDKHSSACIPEHLLAVLLCTKDL